MCLLLLILPLVQYQVPTSCFQLFLRLLPQMKKLRGFRLGRRLVRVWRCFHGCRYRPQRVAYLCRSTSSSSPCHHDEETRSTTTHKPTVTRKLFCWGRDLTRRLSSVPFLGQHPYHRLGGSDDSHKLLPFDDLSTSKPPKGHLVVYVGKEEVDHQPCRFVVPVIYFNHPLFGELLREAEREFGFHHPGGITIPCPISDFKSVHTRVAAATAAGSGDGRSFGKKRLPWS